MIRAFLAGVVALVLSGPALAAVDIKPVTSPGGITAWLVEEHSIPFAAIELRFQGGASLDAPGKRGAINLMTALIEEGAGDLDSQGFAEAVEALASDFTFDVYDDALTISARFLTENRDTSLALLKKALTQTRFDQDAIDRVRGQVVSIIQSDEKDPNRIAGQTFDHLAYGDHPYGSSRNGTLDSVAALTKADMFEARDRVIARDRLFVSAVGDITAEELGRVLDDLLGDLPAKGAPMPPHVDFGLKGGVTVVDFASPQSVVVFGQPGLKREDPDFFAAYLLNQVLGGGGFGSRLMDEVREKRGLTYGVSSYLVTQDLAESWQGSVASANDRVAQAIEVIKSEWTRAATEGVTEAELAAAKTYLTGSYPLRFDGNGPIAEMLVGLQMEGLPITYITDRNALIEAVTVDDIKRVAARLMHADALHFVVVGQPAGLKAGN
jgi:zinc protease